MPLADRVAPSTTVLDNEVDGDLAGLAEQVDACLELLQAKTARRFRLVVALNDVSVLARGCQRWFSLHRSTSSCSALTIRYRPIRFTDNLSTAINRMRVKRFIELKDRLKKEDLSILVCSISNNIKAVEKGRWYHAALDLTGRLLTVCGFASDTGTRLTPFSSQLWLVWFVLLKQIQQFDLLERELAAFDRLDNPDIYFEHAPNLYPRRKGFNDPLLVATTSCGVAAPLESMISNLENGYTEDESESYPNKAYKISECPYKCNLNMLIGDMGTSIYLVNQDYPSAIETVDQMIDKLKPLGDHRFLYRTLGRIYLGV
ncbi:Tetratricopeptide repeat protein [Echinococcus granulosus]|uniref:Tetratricopeptide repeat protein n=1 Tax=Echinococcus granulosus TaxID=6210 RepID=W6UDM2_ECHGR|nr:Tetratricopeptide repeat protein [Echinococcus granulosus]EUB56422.1 Tetratricopeptide repeat protein [Echinococcus granulosus]